MSKHYCIKESQVDQRNYTKALIAGNHSLCMSIEQYYELFGLPPELVSVGLAAAASGEDIDAAVNKAMSGSTTKDAEVSNG